VACPGPEPDVFVLCFVSYVWIPLLLSGVGVLLGLQI
jgi:hypothetical protein